MEQIFWFSKKNSRGLFYVKAGQQFLSWNTIFFYILPDRLWELIVMVVVARQTWQGRRGERWGCQCPSVVAGVTTICFPAKLVLPGGGARPRWDREQLFLKASSHSRHRWRPQCCVVAGFLPLNSQAVRGESKKKVFTYAWKIPDKGLYTY